MSRLEDLIAELCPDEVEFRRLGDVCLNTANISWVANKNKTFRYIDLTSVDRETHSIGDTAVINSENAPSRAQKVVEFNDVIFGTTRPTLKRYCFVPADYDGQICSTGYCVLRADKHQVLSRYIYHLISTTEFDTYVEANQRGSAYPAISDADVKAYTIPVPPLLVQQVIVRILDKFTALEAELEAELEARKKQYEYYRNQLMIHEAEADYVSLKDVAVDTFWIMPATPKYSSEGEIPYITSKNIKNGHINFSNIKRISYSDYLDISKNRPILKDDILISMIGTIGEVARVKESDSQFYGQNMYLVRLNQEMININYFLHFFDSKRMKAYFDSIKNNSGQGYLKAGHIESIQIPLPPLNKQEQIASVLDKFEHLENGISDGLPAEIAARRKQYEYYRDKLLTFKEIGS